MAMLSPKTPSSKANGNGSQREPFVQDKNNFPKRVPAKTGPLLLCHHHVDRFLSSVGGILLGFHR